MAHFFLQWISAAVVVAATSASANVSWNFIGRAVDDHGRLRYVEKHRVDYRDARIARSRTVYFDAQGQKIGELDSDYRYGPRFGSYTFRDFRANYEDGAEVSDQHIFVFRRTQPDASIETNTIARTQRQIVGQGFHHFIANHLDSIAGGEVYHVALVLPSRLDQYDFRIRKRSLDGDRLVVRLEIDNWFLRIFAPYVEADYDLQTGKLLQYRGVSNLADPDGGHPVVIIDYRYPETTEAALR
jgi:hypothetical protein